MDGRPNWRKSCVFKFLRRSVDGALLHGDLFRAALMVGWLFRGLGRRKMKRAGNRQLQKRERTGKRVWLFFCLLEKLRYSNERSTKFESLPRIEIFRGGKWQNDSSSINT